MLTKLNFKIIFLHLVCWMFLVAIELSNVYSQLGGLEPYYVYLSYYALNISVFYGQLWILGRTFQDGRRRLIWGLVMFVLLVGGYLIFKVMLSCLVDPKPRKLTFILQHFDKFALSASYRGLYFVFLGTFYWVAVHLSRKQQQLALVQNAYLRQQINPHLTFNTLNFIYTSVYKYSETGARPVYLLSEIMRYSLQEPEPDNKVRLNEEIEQIKNLISINEYRFGKEMQLEVLIDADFGEARVIPLILFTLAENMFKHGDLNKPATISISKKNQLLIFRSTNSKKRTANERSSQTGLKNTRTRLDFAYGNRYTLQVTETENYYELHLILPL